MPSNLVNARFALDGLTCSACVLTVTEAVLQGLPGEGFDKNSLSVTLFPEPTLIVTYDADVITTNEIIDVVEGVGFGAEILSREVLSEGIGHVGGGEDNNQKDLVHARFALDGLTCSACVLTVTEIVLTDLPADGFIKDSVLVSLFPEPSLAITYNPDAIKVDDIVDAVEGVGFGAELVSKEAVSENQKGGGKDAELGKVDGKRGNSPPLERMIYVVLGRNLLAAQKYFFSHEAVSHVNAVRDKKKKTTGWRSSIFNYTRCLWIKQRVRRTDTKGSCIGDNNEDLVENPINGKDEGGTLCVTYKTNEIGIRSLVQTIKDDDETYGDVSIVDALSYQASQKSSDGRRIAEIKRWRDSLLFSMIFSIPIVVIHMALMHVPTTNRWLHQKFIWHITIEEFLSWLLASPV
eukprot:7773734-Ditylum_brightwellii.AAC.1